MVAPLIVLGIVAIALSVVLVVTAGVWFTAQMPRTVRCPDDGEPAQMRLDPRRSLRALFTSEPERVKSCSRWPEHAGCSRRCAQRP